MSCVHRIFIWSFHYAMRSQVKLSPRERKEPLNSVVFALLFIRMLCIQHFCWFGQTERWMMIMFCACSIQGDHINLLSYRILCKQHKLHGNMNVRLYWECKALSKLPTKIFAINILNVAFFCPKKWAVSCWKQQIFRKLLFFFFIVLNVFHFEWLNNCVPLPSDTLHSHAG